MRVCLTGGMGFVGRRFVKRFLDAGDEVTAVDNMVSGVPREDWLCQPQSLKKLQMHLTDCRSFFQATPAHKFDLIIHLAAVVGGRLNIENDPIGVATDLSIDAEFFQWIVKAGKKKPKVVYFSSSAAYPMELQTKRCNCLLSESLLTFDSTRIGMPDMTYGYAKMTGEYLAKFAVEQYGADVVIYRPFGGYGEDQSFTYPFPAIVKRVVKGEYPVTVWGSGNQMRDFIYIEDIVDAVLATKDKLQPGEALNLGRGVPVSFKVLAKTVGKVLGVKIRVVNDTTKPEGVFARVADTTKLEQWYTPKTSMADSICWMAEHIDTPHIRR